MRWRWRTLDCSRRARSWERGWRERNGMKRERNGFDIRFHGSVWCTYCRLCVSRMCVWTAYITLNALGGAIIMMILWVAFSLLLALYCHAFSFYVNCISKGWMHGCVASAGFSSPTLDALCVFSCNRCFPHSFLVNPSILFWLFPVIGGYLMNSLVYYMYGFYCPSSPSS